jgi:hypothetical protein
MEPAVRDRFGGMAGSHMTAQSLTRRSLEKSAVEFRYIF